MTNTVARSGKVGQFRLSLKTTVLFIAIYHK